VLGGVGQSRSKMESFPFFSPFLTPPLTEAQWMTQLAMGALKAANAEDRMRPRQTTPALSSVSVGAAGAMKSSEIVVSLDWAGTIRCAHAARMSHWNAVEGNEKAVGCAL
jgi:hypothetical protein